MANKYKILSMSKANLTKEQQQAKLHAEMMAKDGLPKLQVTPPKHLGSIAKNEYKRVIESIGDLPLRNLDRATLENYCTWYEVYKRTSLALKATYQTDDEKETEKLIRRLDKATKNIKSLTSDLGMSVNSRMAMNMPKQEENKKESIAEMFN